MGNSETKPISANDYGAFRFRTGPKGEIWMFVRAGHVLAQEFLNTVPPDILSQFERLWERFTEGGWSAIMASPSFNSIPGEGTDLWYFKEQEYCLACCQVPSGIGDPVRIALLSGWRDSLAVREGEVAKARLLRLICLSLGWPDIQEREPTETPASAPEERKYVKIANLAAAAGVHRTTIVNWINAGLLPPPPLHLGPGPNGGRAWPYSDFEKLGKMARGLARKPVGADVPTEYINIAALASLVGVHRSTIGTWIRRRKIPLPTVDLGPKLKGGRAWPRSELNKVVLAIEKQLKKSGKERTVNVPKELQLSSPQTSISTSSSSEVLTRGELLRIFGSWLDGNSQLDIDSLLSEVRRHQGRVAALREAEKELRRLLEGS